jgi:two-component system nitrogen regulation response regulator GlnG
MLPVGGHELVASDFRVISATHRPLLELVQSGTFRHDLYFRLASFQIDLPPLRQRDGDVLLLAEHFLRLLGDEPLPRISTAAEQELRHRRWHGNVRELRNAMEHALILARGGVIEPEHFPPPVSVPSHSLTAVGTDADSRPLSDKQQQMATAVRTWADNFLKDEGRLPTYEELLEVVGPPFLKLALETCHGQVATAARKLGLHRHTLKKKLDQYSSY